MKKNKKVIISGKPADPFKTAKRIGLSKKEVIRIQKILKGVLKKK